MYVNGLVKNWIDLMFDIPKIIISDFVKMYEIISRKNERI